MRRSRHALNAAGLVAEQANGYEHFPNTCVGKKRLQSVTHANKGVQECKALCDADTNCKSFQVPSGQVNTGSETSKRRQLDGSDSHTRSGSCVLFSGAGSAGCDGLAKRTDVFVKMIGTCGGTAGGVACKCSPGISPPVRKPLAHAS